MASIVSSCSFFRDSLSLNPIPALNPSFSKIKAKVEYCPFPLILVEALFSYDGTLYVFGLTTCFFRGLIECEQRRCFSVSCQTSTERRAMPSGDRMLVFVPPHPLIKHWVSVLRNAETPCPIFRNAMAELGRLLIYEASRDCLPTITGEIQTPMAVASVEFIDPREPISIVPILRAGLALSEHAPSILPATNIYHLGVSRDEESLQPTVYLNKLPEKFPEGSRVFVVDPMLATGGTIVTALELIKSRGVENKQIKVISAVAAPPALQKLSEKFPGIHVYAGMLDPTVNEKGLIIPGLGDAGDRSFGT